MKKTFWLILVVSIVLVLALSACQRSASGPPVTTPTTGGDLPFPVPATQNPVQVILTQTAIAKGPTGEATPVVVPTATTGETVILPTATTAAVQPTAAPTAAPQGPAAVWVPTPGLPTTYTIQLGEFPYCIARRFNVDPGELLSLNGLNLNSRPAAGTSLKIPTSGKTWSAGSRALVSHPATYTVSSGDTAYSIGCRYGDVDPNGIIAVNNLQSPTNLTAGQTLQIP
ncbi:LysM peptidoglycan-binding domain-containing protein [bacterium]|nr:MAG: LysM peptidoglycan-binding domain-containing protein [bacterium]